ncbi:MAG: hypothetical protein ACJLS2_10020 [Microcella pacifica]
MSNSTVPRSCSTTKACTGSQSLHVRAVSVHHSMGVPVPAMFFGRTCTRPTVRAWTAPTGPEEGAGATARAGADMGSVWHRGRSAGLRTA